jgi:hypothetical protein
MSCPDNEGSFDRVLIIIVIVKMKNEKVVYSKPQLYMKFSFIYLFIYLLTLFHMSKLKILRNITIFVENPYLIGSQ